MSGFASAGAVTTTSTVGLRHERGLTGTETRVEEQARLADPQASCPGTLGGACGLTRYVRCPTRRTV